MKSIFVLIFVLVCASARAQEQETNAAAPSPTPSVAGLTYENGAFTDGTVLPAGVQVTVTATVNAQTNSVVFKRENGSVITDSISPFKYTMAGPNVGPHSLQVTPWSATDGTGTVGASVLVNFSVASSASPTPTATPSPTPTPPTPTPTPTITPTPTATPSPSPSPTPIPPTPTPTPTITPAPTPTPTPTATPTPSPSQPLVTVTVLWQASIDNSYTIFYGKTPDTPMQVDGGLAFQDGPMCVAIANLEANTLYYFSDGVTWYGTRSDKLQPPVQYTTSSAPNQQVKIQ